MERTPLSIPEIALIGGTRAALGAGVGLLVAERLSNERRRGIGWALLAVGLVSTIPIVMQLAMGASGKKKELQNGTPNTARRRRQMAH